MHHHHIAESKLRLRGLIFNSSRFPMFRQALLALLLIAVSATASDGECRGCTELETRQLDIHDCIQFRHPNKQHVIKDEATMKLLIRDDMSRERCLAQLKEIDFNRYSLVGTQLNTGWCKAPLFTYRALKEEAAKRYRLSVVYYPPQTPCRALSRYDLWTLVPKLPEGYAFVFEINAGRARK